MPESGPSQPLAAPPPPRCSAREPGDDFFCLRYGVWYPSFDCAIRTRFRTSSGCSKCEQGRFNLKRHLPVLVRLRSPWRAGGG